MKAADLFDLSGRVAFVTGASGGLGARFARVLAANGASVVLAARRLDRLEALKAEIEAGGGRAFAVACDITDHDAIRTAFDTAEAAFGTVTIVVNNAGIAPAARALDMAPELWREVMRTNVDGLLFVAQEAARRMAAAGLGGAIVNIASIAGLGVQKGISAYATAKAAVIQLGRGLAVDWARLGIRVNAIAPGFIETDLNRDYLRSGAGLAMQKSVPLGRYGAEADLDGVLLLLASDAGRWMTGATVVVDGGHSIVLAG